MHCIRGEVASSDERACSAMNQDGDAEKGDPRDVGSTQARRAKRGASAGVLSWSIQYKNKCQAPTVRKLPSFLEARVGLLVGISLVFRFIFENKRPESRLRQEKG